MPDRRWITRHACRQNPAEWPPDSPSNPDVSCLPASTTTGAGPADGRATTGHADTAAADVAGAEHGCVAKHVGDDEEADVGAADVDLVEVGDAAVAGGDGDVLKLDVHVVLGWSTVEC